MNSIRTDELVFDVFKTLYVIEHNKEIDKIFKQKVKVSYNVLNSMAKQNTLSDDHQEIIRTIFDLIILRNDEPLKMYTKIDFNQNEPNSNKSKKRKLPKHYGKKQIEKDILSNNGIKTELDRAMLALNDLRNIYSSLKNKGISDKVSSTDKLTEEDCRNIVASVRILKNKLQYITNK